MLTVKEIIEEYLKANRYDGLYLEIGEENCGCGLDDLWPCEDGPNPNCEAAYKCPVCGLFSPEADTCGAPTAAEAAGGERE